MFERQLLRLFRIASEKDFGRGSSVGDERCIQSPVLYPVILAVKVDLALALPEGATDQEKFIGPLIPFIMREKIAVVVQLLRRMTGDDVNADAPVGQSGDGVDLLDESSRRENS